MDEQSELKSPCGRSFKCSLSAEELRRIQAGVLNMTYRNRKFLKSPMDIALYLRLLDRLQPQTIIEIGSKHGGSALWFADMLTIRGSNARVISIDREPPEDLSDPRITFMTENAAALEEVLTPELLATLPRPWLISEDSAHTFRVCLAVLNFFDKHLEAGEYIVMEDGVIGSLPGGAERYNGGPNRAIATFMAERSKNYVIDTDFCDYFGFNVTYNPNGWLRRV